MSARNKYYRIFGLSEGASKDEIRKAYRKLAMQFHPDKNPDPGAHQRFVELAEAYEILMDDRPITTSAPSGNRKEQSFEERKRAAEWRYKQHQEKEKFETERYFKRLTSGRRWQLFRVFAHVSLVLGIILLIEPFLPAHFEDHRIISVSDRYRGLMNDDEVVCIETNTGLRSFVINAYVGAFYLQPEIQVERSFVFRNPLHVWHTMNRYHKRFDIDFSAISGYPAIPLLFMIPYITQRYRRRTYWFTFAYLLSAYLILPCVLYFLFTQERWAHLLTFGFL